MSDQENTSCQQFKDKLREGIQKLLTDGTIAKILQAQIKATNVQNRNSREENHATTPINKASASVYPRADKGKGILHTPMQVENDDEYYRAFRIP